VLLIWKRERYDNVGVWQGWEGKECMQNFGVETQWKTFSLETEDTGG
jgi:hypothetical protein